MLLINLRIVILQGTGSQVTPGFPHSQIRLRVASPKVREHGRTTPVAYELALDTYYGLGVVTPDEHISERVSGLVCQPALGPFVSFSGYCTRHLRRLVIYTLPKSLTVRGKTILGRTSGNPGFGVTGFQVTDNPDKPKHIFDNVLMSHRPPHGASTGVATCTGEGTRASSLAFSFNVSTESTEVVMTVKRLPMAWKL